MIRKLKINFSLIESNSREKFIRINDDVVLWRFAVDLMSSWTQSF